MRNKLISCILSLAIVGSINSIAFASSGYANATTEAEVNNMIKAALENHAEKLKINVPTISLYNSVCKVVNYNEAYDCYYWDDLTSVYCSASYGSSISGYDVSLDFYYLTPLEQLNKVDTKIKEILKTIINDNMTDIEKEKAIHDYIVLNTKYDTTYEKHSPYNALIEGTSVCEGYAALFRRMMEFSGIKVINVTGGSHEWNMAYIGGNWYHVDCTWDDPVPDVAGRVKYNYFNRTDAEMAKDHTWDKSLYPAASTEFNADPGSSDWKMKDYWTGWHLKDGYYGYYINNTAFKGWLSWNNQWYYMDQEGRMQKGFVEYLGNKYYLNNDGTMHIGWLKDGETWYFMDNSGKIHTGWLSWKGKWYYMDSNGKMLVSTTTPDGYHVNADGALD
ncbi:MAG: transglutaminase domain-containing protein [Solirubrobacterales bacterium]